MSEVLNNANDDVEEDDTNTEGCEMSIDQTRKITSAPIRELFWDKIRMMESMVEIKGY